MRDMSRVDGRSDGGDRDCRRGGSGTMRVDRKGGGRCGGIGEQRSFLIFTLTYP